MPKEVLVSPGICRLRHPNPRQLRRCYAGKDAATVPQRFCPARPEANSSSGARREAQRRPPSLGAYLPESRTAGVYLSHLLIARGWQAGTALCFTSLLLPQSESTQPPKAASPVTTTTNKQPPARSHCAGACQRREQRSTAGADEWRHHGAPGRRRRARLWPEGFLGSFTFRVFPTPKRLTPNPEFRRARQKGLPREQRSGERLRRPQPLIGSKEFTPYRLLELNQPSQSERGLTGTTQS